MILSLFVLSRSNYKPGLAFLMLAGFLAFMPHSGSAQKSKLSIGIQEVTITKPVQLDLMSQGNGKLLSLERIANSMGQQLVDRIHNTRKFKVVSRGDLKAMLAEQEIQDAFGDSEDTDISQAFKMAGCKYSLITTIDDFEDRHEVLKRNGVVLAKKRIIRLSAITKIYDTTTLTLFETANFQIEKEEGEEAQQGVSSDGSFSQKLITELARTMSQKAASRVLDVLYPAKVISKSGGTVMLNRGDGTGIEANQIWAVTSLQGETIYDPDTGDVLSEGHEVTVGKIKITKVLPKFSQAVIEEDNGISGPVTDPNDSAKKVFQIARLEDGGA